MELKRSKPSRSVFLIVVGGEFLLDFALTGHKGYVSGKTIRSSIMNRSLDVAIFSADIYRAVVGGITPYPLQTRIDRVVRLMC